MMSPDPSLDPLRTAAHQPSLPDQTDTSDGTGDWTDRSGNIPIITGEIPEIPGYEITGEIARGGMGRVYAANDLTLDREVAIKTLLPGANAERFVTESKLTARLPHPGIPPVHALGSLADGSHYLAMKLIRGRTLAVLLKERPNASAELPRFVQVFEQIAQAVGFAHSRGIIHRDLKPLNVMVGEFGEVQVMDWGLAKDLAARTEPANPSAETTATTADDTGHTVAGTVMGTPGYMAPEQARGESVDARADVFALGSTLAAILTGTPAFVGTTAKETIAKAAAADLSDVLARLDTCGADAELVNLAKKCLATKAEERPADARQVAADVAAYRASVEARMRQAETERTRAETQVAEQRKRRRLAQWAGGVIAAVLSLGIVGTAIGLIREKNAADKERTANTAAQLAKTQADDAAKAATEAANKERLAKEQAERDKAIALTVRDFLQKRLIRQANPFEHSRWAFAAKGNEQEMRQTQTSPDQRDLTVRALVERASQEFSPETIAQRFPDQPIVQAEILETIGETYEGLREFTKAVRFVEAAQAVRERHLGPTHPATLIGQTNLAFSYLAAARAVDAVKAMISLGDRMEALLREMPPDPELVRTHPSLPSIDAIITRMEERSNPHSFSYPRFELNLRDAAWLALEVPGLIDRITRMAEQMGQRFGRDDRRTLVVEIWAAFAHHAIGQSQKASGMYESILARAEKSLNPNDRVLDGLREVLVATYADLNINQSEMLRLLEQMYQSRLQAVGPYHPSTLNNLHSLGQTYRSAGRLKDAIALFEQVREPCLKTLDPSHPESLQILQSLADAYRVTNRLPEAISLFEQLRDIQIKAFGADHIGTLNTLHGLGQTYQKAGRYSEAILAFERVHAADVKNQLGPENPNALLTLNSLGEVYRSASKFPEAIAVYEQIRAAKAKQSGDDHPDTLAAMVNLAQTYRTAERFTEAIKLYAQLRELREKKNGADHPDTLAALSNLALTYRNANRFAEAIELYEQVYEAREKKLGAEHADTLNTLNNLALAQRGAGKINTAIRLFEQIRDTRMKTLGPEHADTLSALQNLAGGYRGASRFPEAIKLLEQVRDLRVKTLGAEHADTLHTLHQLAGTLQESGKTAAAIKLFEEVREARTRTLGPEHIDTFATLNNLALAYQAAGNLNEAIRMSEQLRESQAKTLGTDNPNALTTAANLAQFYRSAGRIPEAIKLFEQVHAAQSKTLGAEHQSTVNTLGNLAQAYLDSGKLPQGIRLLEQVRDLRTKVLGANHTDTLITMNNLGGAYYSVGRISDAIEVFERVREVQVKKLGAEHPHTLVTLANLALMYRTAKRPNEAIPLHESVREVQSRVLGATHPSTLSNLGNLAMAYEDVGRLAEAIEIYERVRDAKIKRLGPDHPDTLITMNNLAGAYQNANRINDAIKLFEQVLDIQTKKLGPDHPNNITTSSGLAMAYLVAGRNSDALPLFEQSAAGVLKRNFQHVHAAKIFGRTIAAYEAAGQLDKAEGWQRKWLAFMKEQVGDAHPVYAGELASLGLNLLLQKRWIDAEEVLRESLAIREKESPDSWTTFNTQSMLGEALLGQNKLKEAEPLLLRGLQGLQSREKDIPAQVAFRIREAIDRLVSFYTTAKKPDEVKKWQAERAKYIGTAPPPRAR